MRDDQDSGFVRQRRNLVIISLVLLFSEVAELTVTKLSLFGNELAIGEPQAVSVALWLAGFYWLWRFYQYSRPGFRTTVTTTLMQHELHISPAAALKQAIREHPELQEPVTDVPTTPVLSLGTWTHKGNTNDSIQIELHVIKSARTERLHSEADYGPYLVRLSGKDKRGVRARAWVHLIIHTPVFTDLMLPYVLFGLPVAYWAYTSVRLCP